MHRIHSQNLATRRAEHGFSLPEVAMAIGIIAVAFVSLLSLLPAGLNTYRAAIDDANETWIIQGINSMIQTTDFANVRELDYREGKEIFYFDEEGKMTDRASENISDKTVINARIYAVKLIIGDLYRPNGGTLNSSDQKMPHGLRVIAVIAPILDPKAMIDFGAIKDINSLDEMPENSKVHVRAFYVARMDSQPPLSSESTPSP
jgi:uncharacterized protein (TIGR02598 family)